MTAKLWAILILACGLAWFITTTEAKGMAMRYQLALAAQDPVVLSATESEFWASLLGSGLHSFPKVTAGQTQWLHVQISLSFPSRLSLGPRESIPSEQ